MAIFNSYVSLPEGNFVVINTIQNIMIHLFLFLGDYVWLLNNLANRDHL